MATSETGAKDQQQAPVHYTPGSPDPGRSREGRLHKLIMTTFALLEAFAVALGLVIYTEEPFAFLNRRLALVSVLAMGAIALLTRTVPVLRSRLSSVRPVEVMALFFYATSMTLSMGATNSPFVALYGIAMLASALICAPWIVITLAILTFGLTFLQTGYLDLMDEMPLFTVAVVLFNALLPAAIAAVVIAMVRKVPAKSGSHFEVTTPQ